MSNSFTQLSVTPSITGVQLIVAGSSNLYFSLTSTTTAPNYNIYTVPLSGGLISLYISIPTSEFNGGNISALTIDDSNNLYVAFSPSNSIGKITGLNQYTGITNTQKIKNPLALTFISSTNTLYYYNETTADIYSYNFDTQVFTQLTTFGFNINNLQGLSNDGTNLYISGNGGTTTTGDIYYLNTSTNIVSAIKFGLSVCPTIINYDKNNSQLYFISKIIDTSSMLTNYIGYVNSSGTDVNYQYIQFGPTYTITGFAINQDNNLIYAGQSSLSTSTDFLFVSTNAICFHEDTQILILNELLEEEYKPIKLLKKGEFVKTYLHGYRKIDMIGKGSLINNPKTWHNCMYKMEKTDVNGLLEDLIVTGGHAILVDKISEDEKKKFVKLCLQDYKDKIDDKYLLLASVCENFIAIQDKDLYTYYHFVLESNYEDQRFGVWANGILSESTQKSTFLKSGMQCL